MEDPNEINGINNETNNYKDIYLKTNMCKEYLDSLDSSLLAVKNKLVNKLKTYSNVLPNLVNDKYYRTISSALNLFGTASDKTKKFWIE